MISEEDSGNNCDKCPADVLRFFLTCGDLEAILKTSPNRKMHLKRLWHLLGYGHECSNNQMVTKNGIEDFCHKYIYTLPKCMIFFQSIIHLYQV